MKGLSMLLLLWASAAPLARPTLLLLRGRAPGMIRIPAPERCTFGALFNMQPTPRVQALPLMCGVEAFTEEPRKHHGIRQCNEWIHYAARSEAIPARRQS